MEEQNKKSPSFKKSFIEFMFFVGTLLVVLGMSFLALWGKPANWDGVGGFLIAIIGIILVLISFFWYKAAYNKKIVKISWLIVIILVIPVIAPILKGVREILEIEIPEQWLEDLVNRIVDQRK